MLDSLINKLKRKKPRYLYRSGSGWTPTSRSGLVREIEVLDYAVATPGKKKKTDKRKAKKPVEVFNEILGEEPKLNLGDLDDQIKLVKRRKDVLEKECGLSVSDEKEALRFLEARRHYLKNKELFPWPVATMPKIEALQKKYKVKLVSFDSYYKNVPMEAIDELEKFGKAYGKVEKEYKPLLKLIVDEGGKEDKKDPILLASSPFGKWFYMLGAWDKEVEIVDDLIYKGK